MKLAMSAKDPYNYYLLLRALFRSIGGGSHDQLYQEFLPLLPTLLQGVCLFRMKECYFMVSQVRKYKFSFFTKQDLTVFKVVCINNI